jgi:hypothetical protein
MENATQRPIPADRFASKHAPVTHELLFMTGFSGKRARFSALAGALATTAVPYLTQQIPEESEHHLNTLDLIIILNALGQ